jgi:hypothetical protein
MRSQFQEYPIAGNSEKTCPGIGLKSEEYLEQLFNQCREKSAHSN